MKHRFNIWRIAVAVVGIAMVAVCWWYCSIIAPIVPIAFTMFAGVFTVVLALLCFCAYRTFSRWRELGTWRRIYAAVTVVVLSALLVVLVGGVTQIEVFAPKFALAVRKIEKLGGRVQVDEARGNRVYVSLGGLDEPQSADADLACLEAFPRLYSLDLGGAQITDTGLKHLAGASELRFLRLPFTAITDQGLLHLQRLTELEFLDLSGVKITDAGLEQLKGLPKLRKIFLQDTAITDAGLERLKALPQLESLDLQGTRVTSKGVESLQKALPKCDILWQPPAGG